MNVSQERHCPESIKPTINTTAQEDTTEAKRNTQSEQSAHHSIRAARFCVARATGFPTTE